MGIGLDSVPALASEPYDEAMSLRAVVQAGRATFGVPIIRGRLDMLYYALVFFIVALIAAIFGFGGIAAGAVEIVKILFLIFLVVAIVTFVMGLVRRR